MSPFPNTFEGATLFPKEEDKKVLNVKNEKLEALTDHIDYEEKIKTFHGYIEDIENGLYEKEYEMIDPDMKVNFMGDPRTSLVSISNESPLLVSLGRELLSRGYESNQGNKNTSFYKIFSDRKSLPLSD